eukprot:10331119-Alexandrium_andersonii.AAC.1
MRPPAASSAGWAPRRTRESGSTRAPFHPSNGNSVGRRAGLGALGPGHPQLHPADLGDIEPRSARRRFPLAALRDVPELFLHPAQPRAHPIRGYLVPPAAVALQLGLETRGGEGVGRRSQTT